MVFYGNGGKSLFSFSSISLIFSFFCEVIYLALYPVYDRIPERTKEPNIWQKLKGEIAICSFPRVNRSRRSF